MSEFKKAIEKYAKYVIQQSRSNLTKGDKRGSYNSSKKLYNSLSYKINKNRVRFESEEYGQYLDQGVRGKNSYYADKATASSPFKYGNRMPPPSAFDKWVIKKGIAPRTKSGKFKKRSISSVGFRKSLTFLIAKSIQSKGIRATLFFTKPFEAGFEKYSDEMILGLINDKIEL